MMISQTQRRLLVQVIADELDEMVSAALAAGASRDYIDAELERRIRKIRERAR